MNGEFARALAAVAVDVPVTLQHPPGPYGEPKRHVVVYDLCVGGDAVRVTHRRASWLWLAYRGGSVFAGGLDGLCAWLAEGRA